MALDTKRIQRNIRKLRKILKNDVKLRSPERVHELRTRTRRIETLIRATGLASHRNEKRLLRELRAVRKKAGKVRDMDVLTGRLLKLDMGADGERDCEVQLLEYLGKERYHFARKLRRAVRSYGSGIRARLERSSRNVESMGDPSRNRQTSASSPRAEAAATALELTSSLAEPKVLNRDNLHPYRLKMKALRYVLKSAQGETDHEFIDALGKCKDAIGEWHDLEELAAIAGAALDHGRACKVIQQLKRRRRKKFEEALEITNAMRTRFAVARRSRAGSYRKNRKRIIQPGLYAAEAIARRAL
jgi:CHAD domain-containing protein